jgi:hypothetical protein
MVILMTLLFAFIWMLSVVKFVVNVVMFLIFNLRWFMLRSYVFIYSLAGLWVRFKKLYTVLACLWVRLKKKICRIIKINKMEILHLWKVWADVKSDSFTSVKKLRQM